MAPQKSPRSKTDKAKKRKRDFTDAEQTPKRQRAQDEAAAAELATTNGDSSYTTVTTTFENEAGWRISKPMGGRMLDIDAILTEHDQYV